jgi:hypothetical protein
MEVGRGANNSTLKKFFITKPHEVAKALQEL